MKKGFTLAEVLITLGIIGIVAAMTIPTLVADYQAKSWSTSASVFERKLEEALKVMNTQQTLAGYTTTEDFVNELKKHIKIIKTCNNDKLDSCFPKNFSYGYPELETMDVTTFTDSSKLIKDSFGTNTVGIQFGNGVSAILAYDPNCYQDPYSNQINGLSCLSMIYDTSGNKSPNENGKDLKMLNVNTLFAFKLGGVKYSNSFVASTPHIWNECSDSGTTTNADDLKFMSDHDIQYCSKYTNRDYWAGAVEACGGTSKMPNAQQIVEISNFLYDTDQIKESGPVDAKRNETKVAQMGFKITDLRYNSFNLWSGTEESKNYAYQRYFSDDLSNQGGNGRTSDDFLAICIVD